MEELFITLQKQSCLLYAALNYHIQDFVKLTFFTSKLIQCSTTQRLNKLLRV